MTAAALLLSLALLAPRAAGAAMDACYDGAGRPQRCLPVFENVAFGRSARASHTCGHPPEDFCPHVGASGTAAHCQRCDAGDPARHHNASYLTDFHSQEETTWWQSPSMAFGVQHPTSVNITLQLGKAYEISYVRLKFHTSRPESFAIYKRSRAGGPWVPYDWVTSTELLISLNRLNTFGDDIFKDPKVLQSYYYAVSDFSVGGRCKCNGHASECGPSEAGQLVCQCQHHTTGPDCERCLPFFQDRPWARSTAEAAQECLPCTCSGHSEECSFDPELFRSTGHGGRCHHCRHHTAGPHCERCRENFYRWDPKMPCQPCDCHLSGSQHLQCDGSGTCACKPTVTGWKCDRCLPGFHSLSEGGCRPCTCDPAGSLGTCDPRSGRCPCKANVEGNQCDRCRPGTFNLQSYNPAGCSSCFCYGHSKVCTASSQFREHHILADFHQGAEGWGARSRGGSEHPAQWTPRGVLLSPEDGEELTAPEKFLGDQRFSYGQLLTLTFRAPPGAAPLPVQLRLEGAGLALSLLPSNLSSPQDTGQPGEVQLKFQMQETSEDTEAPLPAFHFQRLLANLTTLGIRVSSPRPSPPGPVVLTEVQLTSARRGLSPPVSWVETCSCPKGYKGQFCESCAPGYKRETPMGGLYANCVPCSCNRHGTCDPNTGTCLCQHHTEGPSCERCLPGFYGNPFAGQANDCQPCPCPGQSACTTIPESGEVVCTHCPPGQRGRRCEMCDDGFFGDPLGRSGVPQPCRRCQCSRNIDPNAVGNCDPLSGRCLRCLYNTTGDHCERCQEGFYGSAQAPRPADKCAPCACTPEGSVREKTPCDPVTGQCPCLPHVTGRDCGRCRPGFYNLQPGRGCQSCRCYLLGSHQDQCHPKTGQCPCRPGVAGRACDRCQQGFFGFSAKGCRACRCSPLGSASAQCHENSTCVCRPGFVGYKCDHCQDNFFLGSGSLHCQECPPCYSLVKEEAAKLKARLTLMEGWLRGSGCGTPWEPLDVLQGEAPRGDVYQDYYSLQASREAFVEQMWGLEGSLKTAREQLQELSSRARCSQASAEKPCVQLADLAAALRSSEEEIWHAASVLSSLVLDRVGDAEEILKSDQTDKAYRLDGDSEGPETTALSHPQGNTAAEVEAVARRALLVSNTSYTLLWDLVEGRAAVAAQQDLEDRYQEAQAAQKSLSTAVAKLLPEAERMLASVQRVSSDGVQSLASLSALGTLPMKPLAQDLDLKGRSLEKTVTVRARVATKAVRDLQATAQTVLQKIKPFTQLRQEARAALTQASCSVQAATVTVRGARTLRADLEGIQLQFPQIKDQALLRRKAGTIRDRLLADTKKKTKQVERMLGNAAPVSSSAKKKGREAEQLAKDSAKLAQALLRTGKQEHRRASRLASQAQATLRRASRQVLISRAHLQEGEEAEQVGAGLNEMERQIQESRLSLEVDIKALSELLGRLGKETLSLGLDASGTWGHPWELYTKSTPGHPRPPPITVTITSAPNHHHLRACHPSASTTIKFQYELQRAPGGPLGHPLV
ncbi:laminin subunit gamma-3 [Echinops telfairi]|uniref:Laminin subunit gamma-3 n=1 Tax=Echinops telfairi TaxID=9371 RepID=A0AC55CY85_ECHTE|nr:laminin subunit gamma-3 [Echinops telfairi]